MCGRGRLLLRAATVEGADAAGVRPRGSSSAASVREGDRAPGTAELGTSGAGVDGPAAGAEAGAGTVLDSVEVDILIGAGCDRRERWWWW